MPEFYHLTAPKLYAVITKILDDPGDCQRVMASLYVNIFTKSREWAFRPTWRELAKLARREALICKISSGEIECARPDEAISAAANDDTALGQSPYEDELTPFSREVLKKISDIVSHQGGAS